MKKLLIIILIICLIAGTAVYIYYSSVRVIIVEPEETLMIGDTEYDMQMAMNAKTHSVAISHGVHEQERLQKLNPIACVSCINELHSWVSNNLSKKKG